MNFDSIYWDIKNLESEPSIRKRYFGNMQEMELWKWKSGECTVLVNSKPVISLMVSEEQAFIIVNGILNAEDYIHWDPQRDFPRCPCNGKRFCKRINRDYYLEVRKYCDGHLLINKVKYFPVRANNVYYGTWRNSDPNKVKEKIREQFFKEGIYLTDKALSSLWKDIENNQSN